MKPYNLLFGLLWMGLSVTAQENVFLQRSFWKAKPSIAAVDAAIAEGNDPTALTRARFDGVCYALIERADNPTILYMMEQKGNAVDKLTHDGRTYIFWAAYRNTLEIMQWLVDRGAKADIMDAHGNSVLNFALGTGQTDARLFDFLLEHGADIKSTTRNGANALLLVASYAKDLTPINYFKDKGLSFESVDTDQNGLFAYAAKGGNLEVLKALATQGVPTTATNAKQENALFMAARGTRGHQNGKAVFAYLEGLGLAAATINTDGQNLIHWIAANNTDLSLYEHLTDAGLDANLQDGSGQTPLMNAARSNSKAVVAFLNTYVEYVNVRNEKGQSALTMAVQRNQPEVVAYLLEQGADASVVDAKGNSLAYYLLPNFRATDAADFEAKLALLTQAGLRLDAAQHDGNTLLHLAAKNNNLALLKRLADAGIAIAQKNDEGNTALHLAAMSTADTKILKYLIAQGADVSVKTDFEESVFDLASENELLQSQQEGLDFLKR